MSDPKSPDSTRMESGVGEVHDGGIEMTGWAMLWHRLGLSS